VGLLTDESRVAEGAASGIAGFFGGQALLTLLFFFQFEVRLEFALEVGVPLP
jgi:hypothetical protein